jgi:Clr5 domain
MSLINTAAPTNNRHQPSQEEWKELKPKIWQLYIEEDKSLDRVVKLLGEKQGFVLT